MKNLKLLMMFLAVAAMTACGDKGTDEPKIEVKDGTYVGKLVVEQNDGPNFEQENLNIELTFNEDGTADLKLVQAQFAENMPIKLDMTIPGVTATKTSTGYSLSGSNLAPIAMGKADPEKYSITSITGNVSPEAIDFKLNLKMDLPVISGDFPMTYNGTIKK